MDDQSQIIVARCHRLRLENQANKTMRKKEQKMKGEKTMKITSIEKIAGVTAALLILATPQAKASFDLHWANAAISGYAGPYAHVDVTLNNATHATITFTSLTSGDNIYLLGDGGSVAVNVNATSWTLGTITGSNSGTGFDLTGGPKGQPQYSDKGSANVDGFGSFNQTINSFGGFTHSADKIIFDLTNTGGTWASADDVLAKNAQGALAAAHIFVTASPANASNGALATGYAGVPEPTTMIAGALLLLPFGLSTIRVLRRRTA